MQSVEELGKQVIKWNHRLPEFNDTTDEDGDKLPTAIEVQEELTDLTNMSFTKFHRIFGRLHALENMVGTLVQSRDESWEAVSNRVSTLVESSVTSLSGRLTELENALHSHRTTPIEPEDVSVNAETWAASEQVIWSELGRVKEQLQDIPRLQEVLEKIQSAQQSQEKQLGALRRFSKSVEQHLEQMANGALPPSGQVRAGAIRMNITNPEEWAAGDVAVIRNQEAKKVRDIGSLIFDTPIQHDYEEGVEVRSLLSTEQLEEIGGRLAIVDTSPTSGRRVVRFWVDDPSVHDDSASDARTPRRTEQTGVSTPTRQHAEGGCSRESPEFGGGVDYHDLDPPRRDRLPEGTRESPPRQKLHNTPPEDQNPRGCSLHSMEPLRDWFCKGADMTSASEFEACLCQLEEDPPDIRDYNVNIREERWTHFNLEGVRFPAMTVDVIQRGEALAVFERDLIIHFQQISRAAALYVRALLRGVKRALEVYRRVDATTKLSPYPDDVISLS